MELPIANGRKCRARAATDFARLHAFSPGMCDRAVTRDMSHATHGVLALFRGSARCIHRATSLGAMALALGTRRSTLAAVTSAIAAMVLAATAAGRSCRVTQPGPDVTVRDLLQAARTGDRDLVFELLDPSTRAALDAQAKRATDLVGAATRYTAKDLISIGAFDAAAAPTHITVIEERHDHAVVEIVSAAGRARVQLHRTEGRWRVVLPQYGGGTL